MTPVLSVKNLVKEYPAFKLDGVSFEIEAGTIMGFIGRNGAGKTTTLKSVLNLVHPSAGEIRFFGLDPKDHEFEIKQRIGYAGGTVSWFKKKRIRDIVAVTKTFYDRWDDDAFLRYTSRFSIDAEKTPEQLSEGMKVKLNLALALSHNAELLILDEPTSGLDPVSREELLEVFLSLRDEGVAILFSTHITSDLEKCADSITYIKGGRIIASGDLDSFISSHRLISCAGELSEKQRDAVIGECRSKNGSTRLIKAADSGLFTGCDVTTPTLEEIMVHMDKEAER
jgi:ABC-2 type transport system ATP-binding protein